MSKLSNNSTESWTLFLQQERIDIEEKYASLQEEAAGKTKKLKKVWSMLMSAKSEVRNLQKKWHLHFLKCSSRSEMMSRAGFSFQLVINDFRCL